MPARAFSGQGNIRKKAESPERVRPSKLTPNHRFHNTVMKFVRYAAPLQYGKRVSSGSLQGLRVSQPRMVNYFVQG